MSRIESYVMAWIARIVFLLFLAALFVVCSMPAVKSQENEYGFSCYEIVSPKGVINVEDGWHIKVREAGKPYEELKVRPKSRKDCEKIGEKWMREYEKKLKRR